MSEQPTLRSSQQAVVDYAGGKMGVAAVPGAGKTHTLSHLAASLVERLVDVGTVDTQEVLIVTFTNPAVNSFRSRIAALVQQERGLLPYVGYRVRTLHGLAHDIVRMRPGLVGLSENFDILDERVTTNIIKDLAETWIRNEGDRLLPYFDDLMVDDVSQLRNILRRQGSGLVESLAYEAIRVGKDNRWEPDELRQALANTPAPPVLAEIGVDLYEQYQRALSYRGAVDFDDLVRLPMQALETDSEFLKRLQDRWPYILEDEAQDSSKLQNDMLRLLSGGQNWVRVGDPNQAIYTTFTTADSNLLLQFLEEPDTSRRDLPVSGRSAPHIIQLANWLVDWASTNPIVSTLNRTFNQLDIRPTESGDPQQNPADSFIYLDWDPEHNITPEAELDRVVKSIERWLPDHPDWTCAVLVPENSRGFKLAEELKERDIPYEELLRSTARTRDAASRLLYIFDFLAEPTNGRRLGRVYQDVWWPMAVNADPEDEEAIDTRDQLERALRQISTTEDYLWPGPQGDWLATLDTLNSEQIAQLEAFRTQVRFWLEAASLPVDQLILTLGQQLFTDQAELALGHKLAVVMGSIAANNQHYRLPELSTELRLIAQNERRFLGFDEAVEGYEPKPGIVTISTMHAAKGLEWDRVYLMAVNNYSFPADQPGDSYIAEKWFIRDDLNLQAEVHRQLELLMDGRLADYMEGIASRQARIEYAAERLRLLYVGITRAKRDLIVTWNMGRFWDQGHRNSPAQAFIALTEYWKKEMQGE